MFSKEKFLLFCLVVFCCVTTAQISRRTAIVEVVEEVSPCIVNISTERVVRRSSPFDDVFEEFFGRYQPRVQKTNSLGSGVIVDKSGFIVTNAHVIQRASQISVALGNKQTYIANLVAADEKNDLALLKIDAPALKAISWADSQDVMIGETAIALGNPFGLESSVTTGVISAKNRPLAIQGKVNFSDFVQTDAAINPGNSGGALLNVHAQLVGINTAIYAQGQGLGFAIPADRVRKVIGKLLNYEKLKEQTLGLKLAQNTRGKWSVYVKSVVRNSPAFEAGLSAGSVITRIDNQIVRSMFDFNKIVYMKNIGERIRIRFEKNGEVQSVYLKISRRKQVVSNTVVWKRLGVDVKKIRGGVMVTKVRRGGAASRINVFPGDIILSLGQFRIRSAKDMTNFLKYVDYGDVVSIILVRDNNHLGGKLVVE
ncbi:trypsin-like peptidase domain-containing protein [Candidatus Uabimicrobium amorphum]|uniref:Peptidase n=1 Tax=Uabimicrobium amorphum TaxID=2596890 RepID=A0A5S9ILE6_UABAM|nr:trypsin-like peptidase domain-containing protein [Candidatus Uabimicrobium amorphum]BBM83691.1 peptidase [Candidatus Uabimicrobium amorphum]